MSRHLKMDYLGLKRRVLGLSDPHQSSEVGFVEVRMETPPEVAPDGGVVTEMELYRGGDLAMRVRQKGPSGADLAEIVAGFLRGSC